MSLLKPEHSAWHADRMTPIVHLNGCLTEGARRVRGFKHYTKQPYTSGGTAVFRLIDDEGDPVAAFDRYAEMLLTKELATATVKRYLEVVAGFLDYLAEARVFGIAVSAQEMNRAVENYFRVIGRATAIRQTPLTGDDAFVAWARPIADALDLRTVRVADNTVAAINLFLRQSNLLLQMDLEVARGNGLQDLPTDYSSSIRVVNGHTGLSRPERKALRQNSMLANVIRLRPDGLQRPRGLVTSSTTRSPEGEDKDFPLDKLPALLAAASSHRDRLLWTLLAGGGVRTSEALHLRWDHIDITERRIFVHDPNRDRSFLGQQPIARHRFKGRTVSEIFMFEPLKSLFFECLAQYLRDEFIPGMDHDLVFQDIRPGPGRGRPMHQMSDTARLKAFHRAAARAGVESPSSGPYGLHSLRHLYGVYMLNYLPVPGGYGLMQTEVQRLMGHQSPTTTALYARQDRNILSAKLLFADSAVIGGGLGLEALPTFIAKRLRNEAERLEGNSP